MTEADRLWLRSSWCNSQHTEGVKALSIIDQLTARLEQVDEGRRNYAARAEKAEAECERLRAAYEMECKASDIARQGCAAANALLERSKRWLPLNSVHPDSPRRDVETYLAGQGLK